MKQREQSGISEAGAAFGAQGVAISLPAPRRKAIDSILETVRESLNLLSEREVKQFARYVHDAKAESADSASRAELVLALTEGKDYNAAERVALASVAQARGFARRKALLEGSLTAPEVARLLGTSRQTPHDRVKSKTLLAVPDGGALRFPLWQFDAAGPNGALAGLPDVLRALNVPPYSQAAWLTRPNAQLQERTPLEELKRGRVRRVTEAARAAGAFAA